MSTFENEGSKLGEDGDGNKKIEICHEEQEEWSLDDARAAIRSRGYTGKLPTWFQQVEIQDQNIQSHIIQNDSNPLPFSIPQLVPLSEDTKDTLNMIYYFINQLDQISPYRDEPNLMVKEPRFNSFESHFFSDQVDYQIQFDRLNSDKTQLLITRNALMNEIKRSVVENKSLKQTILQLQNQAKEEFKQVQMERDLLKKQVSNLEQQIVQLNHEIRREKKETKDLREKVRNKLIMTSNTISTLDKYPKTR